MFADKKDVACAHLIDTCMLFINVFAICHLH